MDREEAHQLIDRIFDMAEPKVKGLSGGEVEFTTTVEPKPARTDGKRVIRTKSTGDRVYLIDETAKTKAWVTSPEILEKLGFTLNDVEDVDDSSLVGYAMTASVYRVED